MSKFVGFVAVLVLVLGGATAFAVTQTTNIKQGDTRIIHCTSGEAVVLKTSTRNGQVSCVAPSTTTTTTTAPTTTTTTTTTTTSTTSTTTTLPPTTTTTTTTLPSGGSFTVGSGTNAMVFPEKPGLTVPESSLTPYTGPTTFPSTGDYAFSNCLVTRQLRIPVGATTRVSFTNCKIAVNNSDAGYGMIGKGGTLTFNHVLIDGSAYNDYTFPLILEGPGTQTVKFSEFTGNTDNVRSGSAFDFQWNWIHGAKAQSATGGAHSDGIEVYYGGGPKLIAHNYIDIAGAEGGTSSLNLTADFGTIDGVTIADNTFMPGGGYALYVRTDGYCGCGTIRNVNVTGNRWIASNGNRWGGYYGAWSINTPSSVSSWSGNTLTRTNGQVVEVTQTNTQP